MGFDFSQLESAYAQVKEIVTDELKVIKTGRAKPALVEDVRVEAYGSMMPLKELASISAPDPAMILVSPWDQSVIEAVAKALTQNQFSTAVDSQIIRVKIPALTGEIRQEMIKQVAQKIESGKQMVRAQRTDAKKDIEAQEGGGGISEDDIKKDLEELEKITAETIEKLEAMGKAKEEELGQV